MKKSSSSSYESTSARERGSASQAVESAPTREGKAYAYQTPQESMACNAPAAVGEQKRKVVDAFAAFMDALAANTGTLPAGDNRTGANAGPTGTGGYAGAGGYTGTAGAATGSAKGSGSPSAGSGGQRPYTSP